MAVEFFKDEENKVDGCFTDDILYVGFRMISSYCIALQSRSRDSIEVVKNGRLMLLNLGVSRFYLKWYAAYSSNFCDNNSFTFQKVVSHVFIGLTFGFWSAKNDKNGS